MHTSLAFETPEAKTRHDSFATGAVLAAILVSVLSGAFVIEVDPSTIHASDAPSRYAAVEGARL